MIQVNTKNCSAFVPKDYFSLREDALSQAQAWLQDATGEGNDFVGWVHLPRDYDREEFARIKAAAQKIQAQSAALVVIGIGGSYLGARGVIEALCSPNYNQKQKDTPNIYFAGNTLSTDALTEIAELIGEQDFSINVISKSGTTTEPAISFRFFRELCEKKYGKEGARERIYATTDAKRGVLKALADAEGYETFVVPDNVGGRYSVLTAVGLLPIAVCGVDIDALMAGAANMMENCAQGGAQCPAWQYAAARSALYECGKKVEILACYEPSFRFMAEWWKQLYGESEGKDQKGIFPAAVDLTTDLHSMGQFIQDGSRTMFETVINIEKSRASVVIDEDPEDLDGLNYLAGKDMDFVNKSAMNGTILAHTDGNVPNLMVRVPEQNEFYLGELFYMYEFACGVSGYILGVNPFNQPGVESYKKNMFALLGKPGYEDMTEALLKRL